MFSPFTAVTQVQRGWRIISNWDKLQNISPFQNARAGEELDK